MKPTTVRASGDLADVMIYAPIGSYYTDGIVAKTVIEGLQALPESTRMIRVHVNSPGGDPFDGYAIAAALHAQRQRGRAVKTIIEGLAASAATIITSAGDPIEIYEGALMFVHNPYALTLGDARAHRSMVEELNRITSSIVAAYRWTCPKSEQELRAMMDADTWMDADEAVRHGFATTKKATQAASASVASDAVAHLGRPPARYQSRFDALVHRPAAATRARVSRDPVRESWKRAFAKVTPRAW